MDFLPSPGVFWLPESPDDKFSGQLEGDPGKITLSIIGQLEDHLRDGVTVTSSLFDDWPQVKVVHGIIKRNLVTLLDCSRVNFDFSAPGLTISRYSPHYIVFGAHLGSEEETWAVGVNAQFSHLIHWLGARGLTLSFDSQGGAMLGAGWSYTYPPSFDWELDAYTVSLRGGMDQDRAWDRLVAEEYGYFQVKSNAPKSIQDWHREVIEPLHEMLKLVFFVPVQLGQVKVLLPGDSQEENGRTLDRFGPKLVINETAEKARSEPNRARSPEMLFKAEDVTDEILSKFLDLEHPTSDFLRRLGYYERSNMNLDDYFLALVRIIESLHRKTYTVPDEIIDLHAERLKAVTENMSKADTNFILGKLEYAYEPPLDARIHELINPWKTKSKLKRVAGGGQVLAQEIKDIVGQRNYLAHQLTEDRRTLSGDRLRRACRFMMVVARLVVLAQVGFTDHEAWETLAETRMMTDLTREFAQ